MNIHQRPPWKPGNITTPPLHMSAKPLLHTQWCYQTALSVHKVTDDAVPNLQHYCFCVSVSQDKAGQSWAPWVGSGRAANSCVVGAVSRYPWTSCGYFRKHLLYEHHLASRNVKRSQEWKWATFPRALFMFTATLVVIFWWSCTSEGVWLHARKSCWVINDFICCFSLSSITPSRITQQFVAFNTQRGSWKLTQALADLFMVEYRNRLTWKLMCEALKPME